MEGEGAVPLFALSLQNWLVVFSFQKVHQSPERRRANALLIFSRLQVVLI